MFHFDFLILSVSAVKLMRLSMDEHLKARFSNPQNQDDTDLIEQSTYKNETNNTLSKSV